MIETLRIDEVKHFALNSRANALPNPLVQVRLEHTFSSCMHLISNGRMVKHNEAALCLEARVEQPALIMLGEVVKFWFHRFELLIGGCSP